MFLSPANIIIYFSKMKYPLTILFCFLLGRCYAQAGRVVLDPYDSLTLNQVNRSEKLYSACFYIKIALNDSVKFDAFLNASTIACLNYLCGSDSIQRWLKNTYPHSPNYNATWDSAVLKILK